ADHPASVIATYLPQHATRFINHATTSIDVTLLSFGLLASITADDPTASDQFADALLRHDSDGLAVTAVLETLTDFDASEQTEMLAKRWLSFTEDTWRDSPRSIEAVCRWAGRAGRWDILSDAAIEVTPQSVLGIYQSGDDDSISKRSSSRLNVTRLLAESLLQTGRTKQSLAWWTEIVDEAGADDFATKMRLAETAVASGTVTDATSRIAAARAVADDSLGQTSLIDLLSADVQIRQLHFDRGRSILQRVVRSGNAPRHIRGRAQWMIGETFFMQEEFDQAIDAYRLVEGIGSDDQWTAAALVQAGKSFEQLGRTREATMCYASLVNRFGDSVYANGAAARLAALQVAPNMPPDSAPLRR
ncbi:MAG: tetratricopeptide repeat protein, partial [Planctomycetota bacterium]